MVKKFLSLILLLIFSPLGAYAEAETEYWNMYLDGQSVVVPGPHSYTFGGNPYHARHITSSIKLPFKEHLALSVGRTIAQPIVLDQHLILMCGDGIKVISLKNKTVRQSIRLQFYGTSDPFDYDPLTHQLKASSSQITHLPNQTGWWHSDQLDRLICGTRDGLLYCFKYKNGQLEKEWCFTGGKGTRYRSTPMFFFDKKAHTPYLVASSLNKSIYILNTHGQLIKQFNENGELSSTPMIYKDIDGIHCFDRFLIGVDKGYGQNGGYLSSYYALLGQIHPSRTFNQQKSADFNFSGIPASMASKDMGDDILIFLSDKEGRLYCFSEKTGHLLWQIDRYLQVGKLTINNSPSVDDNLVYFTLTDYKGKALLVGIDYKKACSIAENTHTTKGKGLEDAIVLEGGDYTGITYSGTSIVDLYQKEDSGSDAAQRILITSNLNEHVGSDSLSTSQNLFAYYADKRNQKNPVPVKDAFLTKKKDGSALLSSSLSLPGGIVSEPTVSDGYLMVVDGQGILHVYTSAVEKNLAVVSLKTDTSPLIKGRTHVLTASLKNFSEEPIVADVLLSAAGQTQRFENVSIPINGLSLPFNFTVPTDYKEKEATLSCTLDPDHQISDETNRDDNFMSTKIPIQQPADVSVTLMAKTYPVNQQVTSVATVHNASAVALKAVPLAITVDGVKLGPIRKLDLPPNASTTVPIAWHTPKLPTKVVLQACLDTLPETENTLIEENEYNNRATALCPIAQPELDLSVTGFTTTKVLEDTWIVHRVMVNNRSKQSFIGNNRIQVTLQIDDTRFSTLIELEANENKAVPFMWKSPSIKGAVVALPYTATINSDRKIKEFAATGDVWSNNTLQGNFSVLPRKTNVEVISKPEAYQPIKPPPGCEKPVIKWVESRFDHTETRITGYDVDSYETEVTHADGTTSTVSHTRRTPIYVTFDVFKDWHFMTQLTLHGVATPIKLKSGYGFELHCTTEVDTDYDHLDKITGAQNVYVYFPEDGYKTPICLLPQRDVKELKNTWVLPVNNNSILKRNNHYVPVWFPDGPYRLKIVATDQNSPGGSACTTRFIELNVVGNMYEDDYSTSHKN